MTNELLAQGKTLAEKIEQAQLDILALEQYLPRICGETVLDFINHGSHCNLVLTESETRALIERFLERIKTNLQDIVAQFDAL